MLRVYSVKLVDLLLERGDLRFAHREPLPGDRTIGLQSQRTPVFQCRVVERVPQLRGHDERAERRLRFVPAGHGHETSSPIDRECRNALELRARPAERVAVEMAIKNFDEIAIAVSPALDHLTKGSF